MADLHEQHTAPTSPGMERTLPRKSPVVRLTLLSVGVLLLAATPVVGVVPGPGGIFVFAAGLVLVLQNSNWARKRFVRWKARWPRFGRYSDMALRRRSFRRREERAREAAEAEAEVEVPGFPDERAEDAR